MGRGLNKAMLIGRLGEDPEIRYTPSGRPVATFSVGATRSWQTPDGRRHRETEWFRVVAWGNLAEICHQRLRKGDRVFVEGRLHNRRWNGTDGREYITTELVVHEMIRLSGSRAAEGYLGDPLEEHLAGE